MKKKLLILLTLMFFIPFVIKAEELKMDWQKSWGGNDRDEFYELLQTEDGSFIANCYSYSTAHLGVRHLEILRSISVSLCSIMPF